MRPVDITIYRKLQVFRCADSRLCQIVKRLHMVLTEESRPFGTPFNNYIPLRFSMPPCNNR